jgi:hypothetical protein
MYGDLQETYLPAISNAWGYNLLSKNAVTPALGQDPSPLLYYAPNGWASQDLTAENPPGILLPRREEGRSRTFRPAILAVRRPESAALAPRGPLRQDR